MRSIFLVEKTEQALSVMTRLGFDGAPRFMSLQDGIWMVYYIPADMADGLVAELNHCQIKCRAEVSRVA